MTCSNRGQATRRRPPRRASTAGKSGNGGPSELAKATGKAGFFLFLYLEVLDASFSFDGVIGAFAITTDPILIALGLGLIGAMFVRSLTVFLVRKGTLADYVYLEHGAHWAIGALAVILLVGIGYHVNEIVTGLIGVAFIGAAFLSSILRNRRIAAEGGSVRKTAEELAAHHHHHHTAARLFPPRRTEGTCRST